ncbi:hypothetical protein [Jeotgalibacillus proteolyticus]|uniref:hypothetical protein n=1 Tax=Jeotgalibacillus proteolyticus TaxID=2082395 RepID=UPI003CF7C864
MSRRSKASSEGPVNFLFLFFYIIYWWFVLQQIFQGRLILIYVSIIPFFLLLYLQSLTIKLIERKKEKKLLLSVERSIQRGRERAKTT